MNRSVIGYRGGCLPMERIPGNALGLGQITPEIEIALNNLLHGEVYHGELESLRWVFPVDSKGCMAVVDIAGGRKQIPGLAGDRIKREEIKKKIERHLKGLYRFVGFYNHCHRDHLVFLISEQAGVKLLREGVEKTFQVIVSEIRSHYAVGCSAVISQIGDSILRDVETWYSRSTTALAYRFYSDNPAVVSYDFFSSVALDMEPIITYEHEMELTESINILDLEKADGLKRRILSDMKKDGLPQPDRYKDAFCNILMRNLASRKNTMREEVFFELKTDLKNLRFSESALLYERLISAYLSTLIHTLEEQKLYKNSVVFDRLIAYINENYSRDLSVKELSTKFHFNYSYFGNLFKNLTGKNFRKYLLDIRLDRSKELLCKTDLRIYEISDTVGFSDVKYFIRVFKKEFGITPEEFRKLNI